MSFLKKQTDIETMTLRLVSIGSNTAGDRLISLGLLGDGKLVSVIIDKTLLPNNMTSGSIIECVPSRIFGTEITLTLNDSYIRILDEGINSQVCRTTRLRLARLWHQMFHI